MSQQRKRETMASMSQENFLPLGATEAVAGCGQVVDIELQERRLRFKYHWRGIFKYYKTLI